MKKVYVFTGLTVWLGLVLLVCGDVAKANGTEEVKEEWVVISSTIGTDITVDNSSGNVYVTGQDSLMALNSSGNQLWTREGGVALAVDQASGNIYVTGGNRTIAYDSSGNQLWVRGGVGVGVGYDTPYSFSTLHVSGGIKVNPSSGNIYVAGLGSTMALTPSGNQLWMVNYNISIADIAVDPTSGNIYVTGTELVPWVGGKPWPSLQNTDYVTIAYDSSGNQLWVAKYGTPNQGRDIPFAIAVDPASGNVYITGNGWPGPINGNRYFLEDYVTIAYDSLGNQLWMVQYDHNDAYIMGNWNQGHDRAYAIAVDPASGNIYVTGSSSRDASSHVDYATVAYNALGNRLWVSKYNTPTTSSLDDDQAVAIALDTLGNVYVTGTSRIGNFIFNYTTVSYDPSGNQRWVKIYDSPPGGPYNLSRDMATAIAVGKSGNVYVTGQVNNFTSIIGSATIKYSQIFPNQPPVANAGGPYVGLEGSGVTFDASDSSDPDNDPLQYRFDFENDGLWNTTYFLQPTAIHTWYDDYSGTVTIEVFDGQLTAAATASVTINNAAPVVTINQVIQPNPAFILSGDGLKFSGDFTDPGTMDTHTIQWDFDDGIEVTETLAPAHTYTAAGEYTVILTVTDNDGGIGTASLKVLVLTLTEAIGMIINNVESLNLTAGLENSLTSILENAIISLNQDQDVAAVNKLNAFINLVEAQEGKKLTDEQAEILKIAVQGIIAGTY